MKKTSGDVIILQKCTENHDHMLYCSWDIVHDRHNCYFSFWAIFGLLQPPNSPKNQNFKKWKKKNTGGYHHFTHVHQKLWLDNVQFLRNGAQHTDRQTDRRKKWHIEVGAPPKNHTLNSLISQQRIITIYIHNKLNVNITNNNIWWWDKLHSKTMVTWKFSHSSACTLLKIWSIITHQH